MTPTALERLMEAKAIALRELIQEGVPSFPGVVELIKELRDRGIPMAVASGALRHEVDAFIASLGLNGAFCAIVAADEVKKSKPDPETYLLAIERLRRLRGSAPGPYELHCDRRYPRRHPLGQISRASGHRRYKLVSRN